MVYLKFLWSLLRHKWFVFIAGLIVGDIPLYRLIIHDYSKFSKYEFPFYARKFYGKWEDSIKIDEEFNIAWTHHYSNNKHHWNYWVSGGGYPMPDEYIREMVADWMGASRCYTGSWNMSKWLQDNLPKMILHKYTRNRVERILFELGYVVYQYPNENRYYVTKR